MKVLVIGLGSMGKRRVRLLKTIEDVEIFGIDSKLERRIEVKEKFGVDCFETIEEALVAQSVECVVISTSPLAHAAIATECLKKGLHVFTELNLVSNGYKENIQLAKENDLVLFMSSTFMYRKEIQTLVEKCKGTDCPLNYIYHVGQYLPDWHPWESYNDYFIGSAATNGVRELLAIELPWITSAFGKVKSYNILKSKNTTLNINYADNYMILIEHEGGNKGFMAVDVVARKAVRTLDIYGEKLQLNWDATKDSLTQYDYENKLEILIAKEEAAAHQEGYAAFINEQPYLNELKTYLDCINNRDTKPLWDYERDLEIINLIDEMEGK